MKKRHKVYLKLNVISLVFIAISFISVTLAWFAYSGLASVSTEVGVKAWYIELSKDNQTVSNDIVISLDDIYPGMNTVNEKVKISNLGDSDASVNYSLVSARILGALKDDYIVDGTNIKSDYVEDVLSHNYPFHLNISLSKNYILSKGEESYFEVSISWPLDSDNDSLDSYWGSEAYKFQKSEEEKHSLDSNYQIRPSIKVVISVTAEQYMDDPSSSDPRFNKGDIVLYDIINNKKCSTLSDTFISTYVIDNNNKLGDETVTLLPNPIGNYLSGSYSDYNSLYNQTIASWNVNTRPLVVDDLLNIVSKDVMSSLLIRNNISDQIIGNLNYNTRISTELNLATSYNGYYNYSNSSFNYLSSNTCFWTNTNYNDTKAFASKRIDLDNSKIYGEDKQEQCNIIPIILASKVNLEND